MLAIVKIPSVAHKLRSVLVLLLPPSPLDLSPLLLFIFKLLSDFCSHVSALRIAAIYLDKFLRLITLNDFISLLLAKLGGFIVLVQRHICILHCLIHLFLIRSFDLQFPLTR